MVWERPPSLVKILREFRKVAHCLTATRRERDWTIASDWAFECTRVMHVQQLRKDPGRHRRLLRER
jgi:hypothetical protein